MVPDRGPGTGTNYEKRVKFTRVSERNFLFYLMEQKISFGNFNQENGTTFLDFPLFWEFSRGKKR